MRGKAFKTKEFLTEAAELIRTQLPADLRDVQVVGPVTSLVKFHYGNPKIHYEVWVRRRAGTIEVGLHFEAAPEENSRYLEHLISRYTNVIASLGPDVEPEQWTGSWTRVHQVFPYSTLDEDLLMLVSGHTAQMMRVLEPVVRQISSLPRTAR